MPDVFVSYASANESLVSHKVEQLRTSGIDLWFAPDEGAIPGGTDFAEEIVNAIERCKVLLLMATADAFASNYVKREVQTAISANVRIVPLFLERDLNVPAAFRFRLALAQRIDASNSQDEGWLDGLISTLAHHGVDVRKPGVTAASGLQWDREAAVNSYLLPYLADRDTQEELIDVRLTQHLKSMPHRPIAFVVHGPEAQCCDMFADRLAEHSLPGILARLKGSNQLERKPIRWPESGAADLSARAETYRLSVLARLEMASDADRESAVRRIGGLRRPVLFTSLIGTEGWQPDEVALISQVAGIWGALPDIPAPSQPLIVLFAVSYRPVVPTGLARWFANRDTPDPATHLEQLRLPDNPQLGFHVLPQLSSLSLSDIEGWVHEVLKPKEKDQILAVVRALFRSPRKEAEMTIKSHLRTSTQAELLMFAQLASLPQRRDQPRRLPMEPLARVLKSLLNSERKVLRRL